MLNITNTRKVSYQSSSFVLFGCCVYFLRAFHIPYQRVVRVPEHECACACAWIFNVAQGHFQFIYVCMCDLPIECEYTEVRERERENTNEKCRCDVAHALQLRWCVTLFNFFPFSSSRAVYLGVVVFYWLRFTIVQFKNLKLNGTTFLFARMSLIIFGSLAPKIWRAYERDG